jgi:hypothetical protein
MAKMDLAVATLAVGVAGTGSAAAGTASYEMTCSVFGIEGPPQPFNLTGTVEESTVAPGGTIHIEGLEYSDANSVGYGITVTIGGKAIDLGNNGTAPGLDGLPHTTTVDVTVPAPDTTGTFEILPTDVSTSIPPNGIVADCPVAPGGEPIDTVDAEAPTTTTSSTTTTSTTTTTPPTTTAPPTDRTTIDGAGVTSEGCDVSVPIHFAEAGEYTLDAETADGRNIGSTDISRDADGYYTAVVTIMASNTVTRSIWS